MSRTTSPPSAGPTDLLTKSAALRRLELEVRRRLDGRLTGDYVSTAIGSGSERAGARRYGPGDDARRIDWSLTARPLGPLPPASLARPDPHPASAQKSPARVVSPGARSLDFVTARREKREVV